VRRREFITLLGGAASWPIAAYAQQQGMPVVGFLSSASPNGFAHLVKGFREGLNEAGFIEGQTVPAVYAIRAFVGAGGLMSYTTNRSEMYRQTAPYVDRILRGANPAELPVQAPTKYETAINLKTAKALGLAVPPGLLVAADEVIE
jgi:ABC transporter substrate binding protein